MKPFWADHNAIQEELKRHQYRLFLESGSLVACSCGWKVDKDVVGKQSESPLDLIYAEWIKHYCSMLFPV